MEIPNKKYVIHFQGKVTVEAADEKDATLLLYEKIDIERLGDQVTISKIDEGECVDCGGTGEIAVEDKVYPDEPYTGSVGTEKCACKIRDDEDEYGE